MGCSYIVTPFKVLRLECPSTRKGLKKRRECSQYVGSLLASQLLCSPGVSLVMVLEISFSEAAAALLITRGYNFARSGKTWRRYLPLRCLMGLRRIVFEEQNRRCGYTEIAQSPAGIFEKCLTAARSPSYQRIASRWRFFIIAKVIKSTG